jgi:hypothetical protein
MHSPAEHVPLPHAVHPLPPLPHAVDVVPATHCPVEQHPPHDVVSHVQTPDEQRRPLSQLPAWHVPPHPSLSPHAAFVQSGVHPHRPDASHVSGDVHPPPVQHG